MTNVSEIDIRIADALAILNDIRKDLRASKFGSLQADELERRIQAMATSIAEPPEVEQLVDLQAIALESSTPFEFICCDCALTQRIVIVSADEKPIGFAVKQDQEATKKYRAARPTLVTRENAEAAIAHLLDNVDAGVTRDLEALAMLVQVGGHA